jgi:Protein of unknown function (DUF998)
MTTQASVNANLRTTSFFATAAIACFMYSTIALLLMHVLRPDYTLVDHMISDYAVGRYGWVMTSSFLSMSCGILMLLAGLARCGSASIAGRVGTFLLGFPCIGLVVTAIFPTDLEEATTVTRSGNIHNISFLVNVVGILFAVVLLSVSFGSHPRWQSYRRTSFVLASLIVIAFVAQFLTMRRGAPYGVVNRVFVAVLLAWLLATAIRMRTVAREYRNEERGQKVGG